MAKTKIFLNARPISEEELFLAQDDKNSLETSSAKKRHRVGFDTVSLQDEDGVLPSVEDNFIGREMFFTIVRELTTEREKFIVLSFYIGFNNQETAQMLNVDPSRITRNTQEIRKKLLKFTSSIARK